MHAVFHLTRLNVDVQWSGVCGRGQISERLRTSRVVRLADVGNDAQPEGELVTPRRARHREVEHVGPLAGELGVAAPVEVRVTRLQMLQLRVVYDPGRVAECTLRTQFAQSSR